MRFHIIEVEYYGSAKVRYLTWIGKYTYGSCHVRGTSINIFKKWGEFIDLSMDSEIDYPEEPGDDYVFNECQGVFWNDDTNFRLEGFELESMFNRAWIPLCYYENKYYDCYCDDYYDLLNHPENKWFDDDKRNKILSLNVDISLIFQEMREVQKYADENNIEQFWV